LIVVEGINALSALWESVENNRKAAWSWVGETTVELVYLSGRRIMPDFFKVKKKLDR
jgi:hypothetical protein